MNLDDMVTVTIAGESWYVPMGTAAMIESIVTKDLDAVPFPNNTNSLRHN